MASSLAVEHEVIALPCTSHQPCNQDGTSEPVIACGNLVSPRVFHIESALTKIGSILSNDSRDKAELRADIKAVKDDLDKAQDDIHKVQCSSEHTQEQLKAYENRITDLEQSLELKKESSEQTARQMDKLQSQLSDMQEHYESRITDLEQSLELKKEMEERKAARFYRAETKSTLPDSSCPRDRKDSGLSMTSINSSTDDDQYDPGYSSAPNSRSASYSDLPRKSSVSKTSSTLDTVPESAGCN